MASKKKPSEFHPNDRIDRVLERVRSRLAWRLDGASGEPGARITGAPRREEADYVRHAGQRQDAWLTRIYGIRMAPSFWPDAQIFYSGDGLYWRDPFARYALAWREGRPN